MNAEEDVELHADFPRFGEKLKLQFLPAENGQPHENSLGHCNDLPTSENPLIRDAADSNEGTSGFRPMFDHHSVVDRSRISNAFCSNLNFSLDWIKHWSISSYNCTRKRVQQKLNKHQRGVDVELEESVDTLVCVQRRYENLSILVAQKVTALMNYLKSQQKFSCALNSLVQYDDAVLKKSYEMNVDCGLALPRLAGMYLAVLQHLAETMKTLCEVAFKDTLTTLDRYESSRAEFDLRVRELEALKKECNFSEVEKTSAAVARLSSEVDSLRKNYEKLRDDFQHKIKMLQENKVKVMQKNLNLLIESSQAFYSGDKENLARILAVYHILTPAYC